MKRSNALLFAGLLIFASFITSLLATKSGNAFETPWSDKFGHVKPENPLPSWEKGKVKQDILEFVQSVSLRGGPSYTPPEERIAAINLDGTIWCDRPVDPQLAFTIAVLAEKATKNPDLRLVPQYHAAATGELEFFRKLNKLQALNLFAKTFSNMSQTDYVKKARAFLMQADQPRFQMPYYQAVYLPMLELIAYLKHNQFEVYIVTDGDMEFIRLFSVPSFGISPKNVIGSAVSTHYEMTPDDIQFIRSSQYVPPVNIHDGKPGNFLRYSGHRPILAAGSSDADMQMLQYAYRQQRPSLAIVIRHDDEKREYRYTDGVQNLLAEAKKESWLVVSMRRDWKRVFYSTKKIAKMLENVEKMEVKSTRPLNTD